MRISQRSINWAERQIFRGGKVSIFGTTDEAKEVEQWLIDNKIGHSKHVRRSANEAMMLMDEDELNAMMPQMVIVFYTKHSAMAFKLKWE